MVKPGITTINRANMKDTILINSNKIMLFIGYNSPNVFYNGRA